MKEKVILLDSSRATEVADVLTQSFFAYPVIKYFLEEAGDDYAQKIEQIMLIFAENHFQWSQPGIGIEQEGQLVGVSLIELPNHPIPQKEKANHKAKIQTICGKTTLDRVGFYEENTIPLLPKKSHLYLDMLGVLPKFQGQGLAGKLLEETQKISVEHPLSTGVALHTEKRVNVTFYERNGYQLLADVNLKHFHSWCLFRPNPT